MTLDEEIAALEEELDTESTLTLDEEIANLEAELGESAGVGVMDTAPAEQTSIWENAGRAGLEAAGDVTSTVLNTWIDLADYVTGRDTEHFAGREQPSMDVSALPGTQESTDAKALYDSEMLEWRERAKAGKENRFLDKVASAFEGVDYDFVARGDADKVLQAESFKEGLTEFGLLIPETVAQSVPEVLSMVANPFTYWGYKTRDSANERAGNLGRSVTPDDLLITGVANALVVAMDKFSLGKLFESGTKPLKNALSKVGMEVSTENVQTILEETSTKLGTDAEYTADDIKRGIVSSTAGAVGLAGPTSAVGASVDVARVVQKKSQEAQKKADIAQAVDTNIQQAEDMNQQILQTSQNNDATIQTMEQDAALKGRREEQLAKTHQASADLLNTTNEDMGAELEAGAKARAEEAKAATENSNRLVREEAEAARIEREKVNATVSRKVDDKGDGYNSLLGVAKTAKRDTQDAVATAKSKRQTRKQKKAEDVLVNPKATDEQVEAAKETITQIQEEEAVDKAKLEEQTIKRDEEDKQAGKETFLSNPMNINKFSKDKLVELAATLDIEVLPAEGKKRVTAPQYKEAINSNEEVVKARAAINQQVEEGTVDPIKSEKVVAKEAAEAKVTPKGVEYTAEDKQDVKVVDEALAVKQEAMTAKDVAAEAQEDARVAKEEVVKAKVEAKAAKEQAQIEKVEAVKVEIAKADNRFYGWVEEDGTFFDEEGEMFTPPRKARAEFYASQGKADPEAMTAEDKRTPAFARAQKQHSHTKSAFERGEVDQATMDKANEVFNKAKKKADKAGVEATVGEKVIVEDEVIAAPEGTVVEGQAEVDVTTDVSLEEISTPFEDDNGIPMEAEEAHKEIQKRMDEAQQLRGCLNA